ncbi:hypothetical protein N1F89_07845 [Aquibium sp. A9E412]|uniref:hypothetical protein n=1 Tax=Aquibium sp. A9E412 TaxID=2976767 RepID=UPI0025B0F350|nr:hypothetical protein [Aquibium sp. A9E412]MDN2566130.1 hypothetical protein [Aquibium sp. A9E412]
MTAAPAGFAVAPGAVAPVDEAELRFDPAPHPFESANGPAITAAWARAKAANPALYDGRVMLFSRLGYAGGRLAGRCHAVRFATFLHWRARHGHAPTLHAYAHAVIAGSDGALVAVRMAAHTANAGRVYFAAGSFEPADLSDGRLDIDANMAREVAEETGLDLGRARREPALGLHRAPNGTVLFRRYRFDEPAARLAARIRAHVAAVGEPEIDGPVVIAAPQAAPAALAPQMPALLAWHFATPAAGPADR